MTFQKAPVSRQNTLLRVLLEAIALGVLTAMVVHLVTEWTALPDRVPRHFNIAGHPDAFGSKSSLLLVPGAAAGMWVALTVVGRLPALINLPFKVDRSAPEVRAVLAEMVSAMKTVLMLVFGGLHWLVMRVALGQAQGLGDWFLPVLLIATLVVPGWYLVRLWHYREPT